MNNEKIIQSKEVILSHEMLLQETTRFKNWSGPFLVKLFAEGNFLYSLGSGGLLKYKNRYFVITNEHVVRSVERNNRLSEINIPYKSKDNIDYRATIIAESEDKDNDLVALEISSDSVSKMGNHWFLDDAQIETNVKDYFESRSNVVFLHGYPYTDTKIDYDSKVVDMTTQPYTTFIERYDDSADIIMLYAEKKGISEFMKELEITTFAGMSGSFIYGYYMDEIVPYKCLGILSFWEENKDRLGVFPINDVINFLERSFFVK